MSRHVCIDCFDFVEECGHRDKDNMYSFESRVGTDQENAEVSDDRLEEIFSHQPDKEFLTNKEYRALMAHIDDAMRFSLDLP